IYALGILLYQMLVGEVPFDAESDYDIMKMHAETPMPEVSKVRADVPASVDVLIQTMCAKNRDARYQSCGELLAALDRLSATAAAARTVREGDGAAKGMTVQAAPVVGTPGQSGEMVGLPQAAATTSQGSVIPRDEALRPGATTVTTTPGGKVWKVVGIGSLLL